MRAPKEGWLYPLCVIPKSVSLAPFSFACNVASVSSEDWHSLEHPNSNVLQTLFISGLICNKNSANLLDKISFDCSSYKLVKSKVLPFPTHGSHATCSFDISYSDV